MNNKYFNIIKKLNKLINLYYIIILLIIIIISLYEKCSLKKELEIQYTNIKSLQDSIRIEKNKNNELIYLNNIILSNNKNLKFLNKELNNELKKIKEKVIFIGKNNSQIVIDTIYINNNLISYSNNNYDLNWNYDTIYSINNYEKISGNTFLKIDSNTNIISSSYTRINNIDIGFSFTTGIREKNKNLEIFITPHHPHVRITNIKGALIEPHKSEVLKKMFPKRKWAIGPYIGIGIGTSYNSNGEQVIKPIFNLGIGVQRTLLKF